LLDYLRSNPISAMKDIPDYSFRLRFNLPDSVRINLDEVFWVFGPVSGAEITLRPLADGPIKDATRLSCRGRGFADEQSARAAGERVRDILTVALAHARVGADFGDRAARSYITAAGIKHLEQQGSGRVLHDYHGLQAYLSEPAPRFVDFHAKGRVGRSGEAFKNAIGMAVRVEPQLDPATRIAFDLFSASSGVENADSRLLLLMMAIETLVVQNARDEAGREHVERLMQMTRDAPLSDREKQSLLSSLQWLLLESIGTAGRRLAGTLRGPQYGGMAPDRFFMLCYDLRGALVHGRVPRPEASTVGTVAAQLEQFVADLISSPHLDGG
jgi:hypothetical protein